MFDPYEWEMVDWDDEEDEDGNLYHCLLHDVDESVVAEVLVSRPVEVKMRLETAEFRSRGAQRGVVRDVDPSTEPFVQAGRLAKAGNGLAIEAR